MIRATRMLVLTLLSTRLLFSQSPAEQQMDEQRRQIQAINRNLEGIRQEGERAAIFRRQLEANSRSERLARAYEQDKSHEANLAPDYNQQFDASEARAKKEFRWMADPTSPFFKRVQEIDRELERLGIPLFNHPDKPYIIAHIVAHEAAVCNAQAAAAARQENSSQSQRRTNIQNSPMTK